MFRGDIIYVNQKIAWNASAAATTSVHSRQRALDLFVQVCKNASLSLADVAWYVLHSVQSRSPVQSTEIVQGALYTVLA